MRQFRPPGALVPKKRRGMQGPALIICAFVVAGIAYATRNSGGFLGLLGLLPSNSQPVDMPSWMSKPFDKQAPLTHTVFPYAAPAHACCKKSSTKCLKVKRLATNLIWCWYFP